MITRSQAQKVLDQCKLISLLAIHHSSYRKQITDTLFAISIVLKSPEDCTSEIASYKSDLRACHAKCKLIKTAYKWTQKGLTVLQGSTKEPRHPYIIWNRSRYGNPKLDGILEVTAGISKELKNKKP